MHQRSAGFTFIEILVVMAILVTLMGMVAVIAPHVIGKGQQVESIHNVRSLVQPLVERQVVAGHVVDGRREHVQQRDS